MDTKDFEQLTPEEAMEIMAEYQKIGGCGNSTCSSCLMQPTNYLNPPKDNNGHIVNCNAPFRQELMKKAGLGVIETDETIDTVTITPETTDIQFMIESGYIHTLAAVITDTAASALCKKHKNCVECKIAANNWNRVMKVMDCGERRKFLQYSSIMLRQYGKAPKEKETVQKNTCSSCKYLLKDEKYKFCNAWKNYTDENMHCGYYEGIDE